MKKFLFALAAVMLMVSVLSAYEISSTRIGFLSRLNTSEEEFSRIIQNSDRTTGWHLMSNRH